MKLDLMNSRLDNVKKFHHIHDSVDDTIVHPTCTAAPKVLRQSTSFSSKDGKVAPTKVAESQRFESARMNSKGQMITIKECLEKNPSFLKVSNRKSNEFDLLNNHTARIYQDGEKKRLKASVLSRVMDNTHDFASGSLWDNVIKGNVSGGSWDNGKLYDIYAANIHLGPGDYNVKYPDDSSHSVKFNDVPTGRNVTGSEPLRSPGQLSADESPFVDVTPIKSTLLNRGSIKFSNENRFKASIYHQEPYLKTSGMKLSCNYDNDYVNASKVSPQIGGRTQRTIFTVPPGKEDNTDYDPDCGKKIKLVTSAKFSPVKYSRAFNSLLPIGMDIPEPTTGTIGPGHFPGSDTVSVKVKDKNRRSHMFMTDRVYPKYHSYPDSRGELDPFSVTHNRGITFESGGTNSGNLHLQQWTRSKIDKIYPKMGHKKYGTKLPSVNQSFDISNGDSVLSGKTIHTLNPYGLIK